MNRFRFFGPTATGPQTVCQLGASSDPQDTSFFLSVPGVEAPLHCLDLPKGVTGTARMRIATRQLADQIGIADESFEIHPWVPRGADATNWDRVIVVDANAANRWRQDALALDNRCTASLPDYLSLPASPELVVLEESLGTVRARLGLVDGFSAPAPIAAALLRSALGSVQISAALVGATVPDTCRSELEAAQVPIFATERELKRATEITARAFHAGEDALDLRERPGDAAGHEVVDLGFGMLAVFAGLAAFALWSAGVLAETRAMERETRELHGTAVEIARKALIPEGPILDIRKQVSQRMSDIRSEAVGGSGLSSVAGMLRRAADTIHEQGLTVTSVQLVSETGLSIWLVAPDFAAIDDLALALSEAGLGVTKEVVRALDTEKVEASILVGAYEE